MTDNSNGTGSFERINRDLIVAAVIGAVAALIIAVAATAMSYLVEAILPTTRLFCSATMTSSATILAFMLNMIGLGYQADAELADAHYKRITKIALYDALLFGGAVVVFILHCVPIYESDSLPEWWYPTTYGLLVASSVLAGGAITIVSLLYCASSCRFWDRPTIIWPGKTMAKIQSDEGSVKAASPCFQASTRVPEVAADL